MSNKAINTQEIAKRLKQARVAAGYKTAKSFIEKSNLSQSTYSLHETARRSISSHAAAQYCKLLDISIDWLLTGKDNGLDHETALYNMSEISNFEQITSSSSKSKHLSEADLKAVTLITKTKHSKFTVQSIDYDLLFNITKKVLALYGHNDSNLDKITCAISGIYKNISEITEDKIGKCLLVDPLVNTYKIALNTKGDAADTLHAVNS